MEVLPVTNIRYLTIPEGKQSTFEMNNGLKKNQNVYNPKRRESFNEILPKSYLNVWFNKLSISRFYYFFDSCFNIVFAMNL